MPHFKLSYIASGAIALALGQAIIACSDDEQGSEITVGMSGGSTGKGGSTGNNGGATSTGGSIGPVSGGTGGKSGGTGGTLNVPACKGIPVPQAAPPGGGGDNGGGAGGEDTGSGGTAGTGAGGNAGKGGGGGTGGMACAGQSLEVEAIDVDMYIMMDRSISMETLVEGTDMTRWEALTQAMQAFVEDPRAADIGAGIGFFGRSGQDDPGLDCDVSNYSTPDVATGLISDVGQDLVSAMEDQFPSGLTPTMPALQGAVDYAIETADSRPGRKPLVVLVSDGYPTQCQDPVDVSEIADVAEQAYLGTPSVRTYVVGLVAGFNLQSIAVKGGSGVPFLVDEANITESFVQTMLNITDTKLDCIYDIPESPNPNEEIDPDVISVVYTPPSNSGDPAEEIPKVNNLADCGSVENGGWYFDDASNPTQIRVCPCTCSRFQAGGVDIRYGCRPIIGIQ